MMLPPTISRTDTASPNKTKPEIPEKTGSALKMMFASAAETRCWPFCCSTSAIAPGPMALTTSQNHAAPLVHQTAAAFVAAVVLVPQELNNHQQVYMIAIKSVLMPCKGSVGNSMRYLLLLGEEALDKRSKYMDQHRAPAKTRPSPGWIEVSHVRREWNRPAVPVVMLVIVAVELLMAAPPPPEEERMQRPENATPTAHQSGGGIL